MILQEYRWFIFILLMYIRIGYECIEPEEDCHFVVKIAVTKEGLPLFSFLLIFALLVDYIEENKK